MNYGEKIRIFLVFFASTLFLLIGIFTTIVVSGLYFSPVSKDFSLDTVNTYNNLIKEEMLIISEVLEDEKIDKNEKIKLKELSFYNYNLSHGQAVLYGMKIASYLSYKEHTLGENQYDRIVNLINKFQLPKLEKLDRKKIQELINNDKKNIHNQLNYIVLRD